MNRLTLRAYQETGRDFLTSRRRAILADAPGVGKTCQALTALEQPGCNYVLVICPLSVAHHWAEQARSWTSRIAVVPAGAGAAERAAALVEVTTSPEPALVVYNYEAALRDREMLLRAPWGALVADEAHRMASRKTKTFALAKELTRKIPVVYLLTGTPVLNRPDEIWTLLHLVNPAAYRSYWRWVRTYCDTTINTYRKGMVAVEQVTGPKATMLPILREELSAVLLRRELDEVLPELPEVSDVAIQVDLSPPERKAYAQMAERFFTEFDGQVVIAANEVSKITRLRQLVADWETFGATESGAKIKATTEIVADLAPEQVVVFCSLKAPLETLKNSGVIDALITGDVSKPARQAAIAAFQSKEIRVLGGTIRAMGEGINLQNARYVVFIDRDWTPARNAQALARIHRYGQHDPVTAYNIIARNTIDSFIAKTLRRKVSIFDALLGKDLNVMFENPDQGEDA